MSFTLVLLSTLSHIFAAIINPLPSPAIILAIVKSCLSKPFVPSTSKTHTLLYFTVFRVSLTISISNGLTIFDFFLRPAVSTIQIDLSL